MDYYLKYDPWEVESEYWESLYRDLQPVLTWLIFFGEAQPNDYTMLFSTLAYYLDSEPNEIPF